MHGLQNMPGAIMYVPPAHHCVVPLGRTAFVGWMWITRFPVRVGGVVARSLSPCGGIAIDGIAPPSRRSKQATKLGQGVVKDVPGALMYRPRLPLCLPAPWSGDVSITRKISRAKRRGS